LWLRDPHELFAVNCTSHWKKRKMVKEGGRGEGREGREEVRVENEQR